MGLIFTLYFQAKAKALKKNTFLGFNQFSTLFLRHFDVLLSLNLIFDVTIEIISPKMDFWNFLIFFFLIFILMLKVFNNSTSKTGKTHLSNELNSFH